MIGRYWPSHPRLRSANCYWVKKSENRSRLIRKPIESFNYFNGLTKKLPEHILHLRYCTDLNVFSRVYSQFFMVFGYKNLLKTEFFSFGDALFNAVNGSNLTRQSDFGSKRNISRQRQVLLRRDHRDQH